MDSMIGRTIGRYRIVEHLGRGGMAEVYKAYQPNLDRYVAIKMMHAFLADEKEFLTRFEREAKVVATLRHPNIVQVHDFDVEGGAYYMVMEFISGETLKSRMQNLETHGQWVSLDDAARVILSVGSALKYAHERGMVHRDVKPANVMITLEGQVILTDFGIAKIVSTSNLTASGAMVGTPSYMAPEQGMGQPGDERSDIYSLGVMLYQLVLGRLPYDADTPLAVVLKHINEPLPLPKALKPDISEELNCIILKSLAKDPNDRYQKVADLLADLRKAMGLSPEDSQTNAAKGSAIKLTSATMVGRVGSGVTPLPTQVSAPKTVVAGAAVAGSPTAVLDASTLDVSTAALPVAKKHLGWLIPALGIGLIAIVAMGIGAVLGGRGRDPTPTSLPSNMTTPTATLVAAPSASVTPTDASTQAAEAAVANTPTDVPTTVPTPVQPTATPHAQVSVIDGMTLLYVPGGKFIMGGNDGDSDEKPPHEVDLDAFWIDQTEVTNAMYQQFAEATHYRTRAEQVGKSYVFTPASQTWKSISGANWQHNVGASPAGELGQYPVVHVSWYDALQYCQWAGRRLPTEAEWEKAARGVNGSLYPWGNDRLTDGRLNYCDVQCSYSVAKDPSTDDGYEYTAPVGTYLPGASPYGALDMAGNVYEWVNDWYDKQYYSVSPSHNPLGPPSGNERVMKSGGWQDTL